MSFSRQRKRQQKQFTVSVVSLLMPVVAVRVVLLAVVVNVCNLDLGRHVCRVTANTPKEKQANNELMGQAIECSYLFFVSLSHSFDTVYQ